MGTLATVEVWSDTDALSRAGADAAVQALEDAEALLSSWRTDTEVGGMNAAPVGQPVALSEELTEMLTGVLAWSRRTHGAFHPVVGALVDAWDLRGEGRIPSPSELAAALRATGDAGMAFDSMAGSATRLHEGAWLDAGGFGKGAALAAAGRALEAQGARRARVDLGGQLLLVGGEPVTVGVAHPARRAEVAATLRLTGVSVATSGQSERSLQVEGRRVGHVLDPRTGEPVEPWGSVTVVAEDPTVADVLATAFLVLGPEEGMKLAEDLSHIGVLFMDDSGDHLTARHNRAMRPFIRELPGGSGHASTSRDVAPSNVQRSTKGK